MATKQTTKGGHYELRASSFDDSGDGPDLESDAGNAGEWKRLAVILGVFQAILMALFGLFVEYDQGFFTQADQLQYVFYLDVTVMMLVGFGFLMTFPRKYGLGAVGLTFLITVICVPWCILTGRFFASIMDNVSDGYPGVVNRTITHRVMNSTKGGPWTKIQLDVNALLQGTFASAAVLISFGALIGKVTPSQAALLAILEVPLYSLNKEVVAIGVIGTLDMGGTIFIHLFGAYFGLAAAWVLGPPSKPAAEDAEPSHVSDLFSLIGTVFLWIYWPSFNGATAGGDQQMLTTVNTVMALCASCMATFTVSAIINKRISTVDVQNATLAGGVAIGASSNLAVQPLGAMLIGTLAAVVSVVGFNKVQPILEDKLNLHDSCGVHNLHGMPAILGSLCVTVATACPSFAKPNDVVFPLGANQPWAQLGGAGATFVIAIASGLLVGVIVKKLLPPRAPAFTDAPYWTVAPTFAKMV